MSRFVRIEKCGHAIDTRHRCGWALHRSLQSISHRLPFYVPTGRTILEALPNHRQKRVHVPALRLEFTHTHTQTDICGTLATVGQPCLIAYVACETTPAQAAQARFSYCKAFAALQQLSEAGVLSRRTVFLGGAERIHPI